ncbi:MAG: BatA domain-containing protein, partial [Rhizobiales bacterium]|nr:BatA domain-containing protein [Hyphomicrobiales bacterium]
MPFLEAISFTTPWALAALALLPVIWWLLRFTPPRPQTLRFPPLRILLQLVSREDQADHTPWWLMALRLLIATLLILAVAHPLFSRDHRTIAGNGPLLLIVDDGWAAAKDWQARQAIISETLVLAERQSRPVAFTTTSPSLRDEDIVPVSPQVARDAAAALEPKAFDPDRTGLLKRLETAFGQADAVQVLWLSDGLDYGSAQPFATGLTGLAKGRAGVEVIVPDEATIPAALVPPVIEGNRIKVKALRPARANGEELTVEALASNGRSLADARIAFRPGAGVGEAQIELPLELRNEAQRIVLRDERAASAVYLLDDRWRRKTVGLVAGSSIELAQPLLSPLYYVSRALEPYAEIYEPQTDPELAERLKAGLSMLVLADVGVLPSERRNLIEQWVNGGGVLLRFAGPRLAGGQDDLIPVTMREGDRSLGSALSWEEPQPLQPFPDQSPFAGLSIDPQVKVARQVLAEPDADLPSKVWASLADGTPLVTAKKHGNGLVILVHVTANADWSNLPLSGLFVDLLRRIVDLAPGAGGGATGGAAATEATASFAPRRLLAGNGDLVDPTPDSRPVAAGEIDRLTPTPEHPAGLYRRGGSERAINLVHQGDGLRLMGAMPAGVSVRDMTPAPALDLARWLFLAAFILFLI